MTETTVATTEQRLARFLELAEERRREEDESEEAKKNRGLFQNTLKKLKLLFASD